MCVVRMRTLIVVGCRFAVMGLTWIGCCLIPFCIPSAYDTAHVCPQCGVEIAVHKPTLG